MNALNPIEELYNLYLDEEVSSYIMEIDNNRLGFNSDLEDKLADPYLKL